MQIYVIKNGDNLYDIANSFNSTVEEIATANEIKNPDVLVVGQTIVIPIVGSYYFVKPGDTLINLGQRFDISYITLALINKINPNSPLKIGQKLYIPPQKKPFKNFNGYIEPLGGKASDYLLSQAEIAAPHLTYMAPFSYQIEQSTLELKPVNVEGILPIAQKNNNELLLVVTNIKNGQFDDELAREFLKDKQSQMKLLNNILKEANSKGYFSDIHFDIEYLPPEMRENYNMFLKRAVDLFHKAGYMVSSALAPKTSDNQKGRWYEGHDYGAHGSTVDFVVLMTYEWGYSAGPPLPVSPIGPVKKVLDYAVTRIPSSKILMGQNLYGYNWTLPFKQGTYADALSPQRAIEIAEKYNQSIKYDMKAQAPYFRYKDVENKMHIVWFEDARSIQAKFDLVKSMNLLGVSYWKLGLNFPQNWLLIENNFKVNKKT